MKPSPEDINAIVKLKDLPVNLSIDGITAFMIIAHLQLALRHPGNRGDSSEEVRSIVIYIQNQLQTRVPEIKSLLDKGWHPEFDISTNERIVSVHNVYTLYSNNDEDKDSLLSVSSRPQDWGDPRWNYHFVKLETKYENTIYINHLYFAQETPAIAQAWR